MTDLELLELAAKAAGIPLYIWGTKGNENVARLDEVNGGRWNPLTDDGDALQLAATLRLPILWDTGEDEPTDCFVDCHFVTEFFIDSGNDPAASMRRAIIRVAAEIGRAMQ
jgi:hypothetical protein